ncbi:hypothetical protein Anapl_19106 [Anas platyrhynchos]|uniref:Uncharacterized protein n=1 Tax=Anas platyrhynchos TaxID=8839 RepID=R0KWQ1_ANAPL|nr:hypothetical protein Anapl_19106 [Anas platyrhynchos]
MSTVQIAARNGGNHHTAFHGHLMLIQHLTEVSEGQILSPAMSLSNLLSHVDTSSFVPNNKLLCNPTYDRLGKDAVDESLEVKHEIFARSAVDPDTEGEQDHYSSGFCLLHFWTDFLSDPSNFSAMDSIYMQYDVAICIGSLSYFGLSGSSCACIGSLGAHFEMAELDSADTSKSFCIFSICLAICSCHFAVGLEVSTSRLLPGGKPDNVEERSKEAARDTHRMEGVMLTEPGGRKSLQRCPQREPWSPATLHSPDVPVSDSSAELPRASKLQAISGGADQLHAPRGGLGPLYLSCALSVLLVFRIKQEATTKVSAGFRSSSGTAVSLRNLSLVEDQDKCTILSGISRSTLAEGLFAPPECKEPKYPEKMTPNVHEVLH